MSKKAQFAKAMQNSTTGQKLSNSLKSFTDNLFNTKPQPPQKPQPTQNTQEKPTKLAELELPTQRE